MVAEIFFLFLTENSEQNNPMEQKRQEYHDHEQSKVAVKRQKITAK